MGAVALRFARPSAHHHLLSALRAIASLSQDEAGSYFVGLCFDSHRWNAAMRATALHGPPSLALAEDVLRAISHAGPERRAESR